ncbi:hypothetical protein SUDANB121_00975 [Nocardiopsis dassonvillei]|uniref:hypothetical protein n=1 Tax=Nocardiopsis dassonvillei TaxID=2014 RepID=UPI003F544F5C
MADRTTAVAGVLSRSLSGRVVLCGLFGAQAAVLEHNVSVEVVARYKRASLDRLATMAALVRKHLPELGESAALFVCRPWPWPVRSRRTALTRPASGRPTGPSPTWPAFTWAWRTPSGWP